MTHADFLADIAANPADMGPRLVFADWLEERGGDDAAQAEYIRTAVELASFAKCAVCGWKIYSEAKDGCTVFSCAMRPMVPKLMYDNIDQFHKQRLSISRLDALLTPQRRRKWTMRGLKSWYCLMDGHAFYAREPDQWNMTGISMVYPCEVGNIIKLDFRAGFPEIVTCAWPEWQRHHKAICAAHPVRVVKLTQWPTPETFEVPVRFLGRSWTEALAAEIPGADPQYPIRYELAATLAREPALG